MASDTLEETIDLLIDQACTITLQRAYRLRFWWQPRIHSRNVFVFVEIAPSVYLPVRHNLYFARYRLIHLVEASPLVNLLHFAGVGYAFGERQ